MKRNIDKLVRLAKRYVEYGKQVHLPEHHNNIAPSAIKEGENYVVYFADNRGTASVQFANIEVAFYCDKVTLPINANAQYLDKIFIEGTEILKKWKEGKL